MPTEHIKYTDSLRQGTDRLNQAIDAANAAEVLMDEGILIIQQKTDEAVDIATTAATNADGKATLAQQAATDADQATSNANAATTAINLVLPNVEGLEYVELWDAATTYVKNNIVRRGKNSYIALQSSVGVEPTGTADSPDWGVLAVGGLDGSGSVVTVNGISPDEFGNVLLDTVSSAQLQTVDGKVDDLQTQVTTHWADYLSHTGYAVATGTANEYIATLTPALSSYAEGVSLRLKINVENTGASTVNVNGLGAKSIKKSNGSAVSSGNLKLGSVYTFAYDGTSFILQGEGGEYGTAVAGDVLTGKTIGTENGIVSGTLVLNKLVATPGDSTFIASTAEVVISNAAFVKVKEILSNFESGTVRIKFSLRASSGNTAYGQIYKNGVAVGALRSNNTTTEVFYAEDIAMNKGDLIQLYLRGFSSGSNVHVRNFEIAVATNPFGTVNL